MELQAIKEEGGPSIILCHEHWKDYIITHTTRAFGARGSIYYVTNSHEVKQGFFHPSNKNMFCRECRKLESKGKPTQ